MKALGMRTRRVLLAFLAFVLIFGSFAIGPNVQLTSAHLGESVFALVNEPIGVAATPGRLLVTHPWTVTQAQFDAGVRREVLSIDGAGNVSVFATLPTRVGSHEEYIAVAGPADPSKAGFPSPTPAGFVSNTVYVTQGPVIRKISFDRSSVTQFAELSSCPASHNGITFDRVGSFGFNMIVACNNGQVWKVTSGASATLVATIYDFIEGPDVAPLSFTSCPGCIPVAAEFTNTVYGVRPPQEGESSVVTVASWTGAESVHFVPSSKCTSATSGGTFFTAIFPVNVTKFPISAFAGLGGRALVTSEFGGGIGLITSTGSLPITPTLFHANFGQHEGSAFVDCTVPLLLEAEREPGSINPKAPGLVTVFIFKTANFNPESLIPETLRLGITGTEQSFAFCVPGVSHRRGRPARDCKFHKNLLGIPSEGIFRGTLILKGKYQAPTGDPDAEGGGI